MGDTTDTDGGGDWGPHGLEIRDMAIAVLEAANDLRFMEVLDEWGWDYGPEDVSGQGDTDRESARAWVANSDHAGMLESPEFRLGSEFDYVPGMFQKYAVGCGLSGYQAMIADLDAAIETLKAAHDTSLEQVRPKVSEVIWTGKAADEFRDKVLDPMTKVSSNQIALLAELRAALEGHALLIEKAQQGALEIGRQTKEALERAMAEETASSDPANMFSILGTILSVGGMFVPGTQGFALALAILSTVSATAQAGYQLSAQTPPATEAPSLIGGATAHLILATTRIALGLMDGQIAAEEAMLAQALNRDVRSLDEVLGSPDKAPEVRASRVAIADGVPTKDAFTHWSPVRG